jgi:predicted nucleotidyltransferase
MISSKEIDLMASSAERQRKRRARLREQGVIDVTVPVPWDRAGDLRLYARRLNKSPAAAAGERLIGVLLALKSIRGKLTKSGVRHAAVFGSVARGEDRPDSDIDILISIDAAAVKHVLNFIKITDHIEQAVRMAAPNVDIDVADRETLKPRIKAQAEKEAIYAF